MPIQLPNAWRPRDYQRPAWNYLEKCADLGKPARAALVWHRRSGKDSLALNYTATAMHRRKGVYWHMLPEAEQARKAVWNGIDAEGRRIIDQVFPGALNPSGPNSIVKSVDKQTMAVETKFGSIWQLVGSDNYNSLVGSNPVGVVYSEYSIADPAARDFLRPILLENGGWEIYAYTPRGKNHGFDLYQKAKLLKDEWFAQLLTVDDTKRLTPAQIQSERDNGMDEDMIRQEYYCSFDAAMRGAYYGDLFEAAEKDGRLGKVEYDPAVPVETWWDLGIGDSTAIWFMQRVGREWHAIDYHEAHGQGLDYYARLILNKPYVYSRHVGPHDLMARELGTGKTRLEMLAALGLRMDVAPKLKIDDGIMAARQILPLTHFDMAHCGNGVKALSQYRRAWNESSKMFLDHPHHDWTSHAADAFRTGVTADGRRAASNFNRPLNYSSIRVGA